MADNRSAEDFRAERVRLELQLQRANSQGARQFVMDEMKLLDQEEAAARSTTTAGLGAAGQFPQNSLSPSQGATGAPHARSAFQDQTLSTPQRLAGASHALNNQTTLTTPPHHGVGGPQFGMMDTTNMMQQSPGGPFGSPMLDGARSGATSAGATPQHWVGPAGHRGAHAAHQNEGLLFPHNQKPNLTPHPVPPDAAEILRKIDDVKEDDTAKNVTAKTNALFKNRKIPLELSTPLRQDTLDTLWLVALQKGNTAFISRLWGKKKKIDQATWRLQNRNFISPLLAAFQANLPLAWIGKMLAEDPSLCHIEQEWNLIWCAKGKLMLLEFLSGKNSSTSSSSSTSTVNDTKEHSPNLDLGRIPDNVGRHLLFHETDRRCLRFLAEAFFSGPRRAEVRKLDARKMSLLSYAASENQHDKVEWLLDTLRVRIIGEPEEAQAPILYALENKADYVVEKFLKSLLSPETLKPEQLGLEGCESLPELEVKERMKREAEKVLATVHPRMGNRTVQDIIQNERKSDTLNNNSAMHLPSISASSSSSSSLLLTPGGAAVGSGGQNSAGQNFAFSKSRQFLERHGERHILAQKHPWLDFTSFPSVREALDKKSDAQLQQFWYNEIGGKRARGFFPKLMTRNWVKDLVKYLYTERNLNVNERYSGNQTWLFYFAKYGTQLDVLKYLVEELKAEIDVFDSKWGTSRTCLHYAAKNPCREIFVYLLAQAVRVYQDTANKHGGGASKDLLYDPTCQAHVLQLIFHSSCGASYAHFYPKSQLNTALNALCYDVRIYDRTPDARCLRELMDVPGAWDCFVRPHLADLPKSVLLSAIVCTPHLHSCSQGRFEDALGNLSSYLRRQRVASSPQAQPTYNKFLEPILNIHAKIHDLCGFLEDERKERLARGDMDLDVSASRSSSSGSTGGAFSIDAKHPSARLESNVFAESHGATRNPFFQRREDTPYFRYFNRVKEELAPVARVWRDFAERAGLLDLEEGYEETREVKKLNARGVLETSNTIGVLSGPPTATGADGRKTVRTIFLSRTTTPLARRGPTTPWVFAMQASSGLGTPEPLLLLCEDVHYLWVIDAFKLDVNFVNRVNRDFYTVLHHRALSRSPEAVNLLIEKGAGPNLGKARGCASLPLRSALQPHLGAAPLGQDALSEKHEWEIPPQAQAQRVHFKCVARQLLLYHGANPRADDLAPNPFSVNAGITNPAYPLGQFPVTDFCSFARVCVKDGAELAELVENMQAAADAAWELVANREFDKLVRTFGAGNAEGGDLNLIQDHKNQGRGLMFAAVSSAGGFTLRPGIPDGKDTRLQLRDLLLNLRNAGVDPFRPDSSGRSALFFAAERGVVEAVDVYLQDFKADVHSRDFEGKTALFAACQGGESVEVVEKLLERGGAATRAVGFRDEGSHNGLTALFEALSSRSRTHHLRIVELLLTKAPELARMACRVLESGTNVFTLKSPLRHALDCCCDKEILDLIYNTSANFFSSQAHASSEGAESSRDLGTEEAANATLLAVCRSGSVSGFDWVLRKICENYRGLGTSAASAPYSALRVAGNSQGRSSVTQATAEDMSDGVPTWLDALCTVKTASGGGENPLHVACAYAHRPLAWHLLNELQMDVQALCPPFGRTAVFKVMEITQLWGKRSGTEVLDLLLECGASFTHRDSDGKTPQKFLDGTQIPHARATLNPATMYEHQQRKRLKEWFQKNKPHQQPLSGAKEFAKREWAQWEAGQQANRLRSINQTTNHHARNTKRQRILFEPVYNPAMENSPEQEDDEEALQQVGNGMLTKKHKGGLMPKKGLIVPVPPQSWEGWSGVQWEVRLNILENQPELPAHVNPDDRTARMELIFYDPNDEERTLDRSSDEYLWMISQLAASAPWLGLTWETLQLCRGADVGVGTGTGTGTGSASNTSWTKSPFGGAAGAQDALRGLHSSSSSAVTSEDDPVIGHRVMPAAFGAANLDVIDLEAEGGMDDGQEPSSSGGLAAMGSSSSSSTSGVNHGGATTTTSTSMSNMNMEVDKHAKKEKDATEMQMDEEDDDAGGDDSQDDGLYS